MQGTVVRRLHFIATFLEVLAIPIVKSSFFWLILIPIQGFARKKAQLYCWYLEMAVNILAVTDTDHSDN
jgi:hypothetical protein